MKPTPAILLLLPLVVLTAGCPGLGRRNESADDFMRRIGAAPKDVELISPPVETASAPEPPPVSASAGSPTHPAPAPVAGDETIAPPAPVEASVPGAPAAGQMLRIARKGSGDGYVLLQTRSGLPDGTRLVVFRDGKPVGSLRVSGPRRPGWLTADIVDGDIRAGDLAQP